MKTIGEFQREVGEWALRNFPNQTPQMCYEGVFEETGELAHTRLKRAQGIRGTAAEHDAAEKDGLADLFIFLCDYCNRSEIDLETEMSCAWGAPRNTLAQVSDRVMETYPDLTYDDSTSFRWLAQYVGDLAFDNSNVTEVLWFLCCYAVARGIDMQAVAEETWERVRRRDWVADPASGGEGVAS